MSLLDKVGINGKFMSAGFMASVFSFIVGFYALNAFDHLTNQIEIYEQQKIAVDIKEKTEDLKAKVNSSVDKQSLLDYKNKASGTIWIILTIATIGCLGMGWLFAKFLGDALVALSSKLKDNSSDLELTARELTDSGAALASSTTQQAAALQETVSAIVEISALLNKTAENAQLSQEVSEKSHISAERGKTGVSEVMNAMHGIAASNTDIIRAIEDSNNKISDITKVIFHIGEKTKVINEIVFQTKLLSFNAAVEAARAGEQGKGFSVVAEEVGNLAQMSGQAAKEITDMLAESIRQVEQIVNESKNQVSGLIADNKYKVEIGTNLAENCATILDEIVRDVSSTKEITMEISTSIREQSHGVSEISRAMNQLEEVTQRNSNESRKTMDIASDVENRAKEVSAAAMRLVGIVNFKLSETEAEKIANQ